MPNPIKREFNSFKRDSTFQFKIILRIWSQSQTLIYKARFPILVFLTLWTSAKEILLCYPFQKLSMTIKALRGGEWTSSSRKSLEKKRDWDVLREKKIHMHVIGWYNSIIDYTPFKLTIRIYICKNAIGWYNISTDYTWKKLVKNYNRELVQPVTPRSSLVLLVS